MADTTAGEFPVWHTPEGEKVSCVEKIKVLNENLAELRGAGAGRARGRGADGLRRAPGPRGARRHRRPVSSTPIADEAWRWRPSVLALVRTGAVRGRGDDSGADRDPAGARQDHRAGLAIRGAGRHRRCGSARCRSWCAIARRARPRSGRKTPPLSRSTRTGPERTKTTAVQRLDVFVEPGVVGARAPRLRRQPARMQTAARRAGAASPAAPAAPKSSGKSRGKTAR